MLSVVLIDIIALELLHKVNRKAMVRMPPVLLPDSLVISSAMMRTTSGGATWLSRATISSVRLAIGKKLAIDSSARIAGNRAKKK